MHVLSSDDDSLVAGNGCYFQIESQRPQVATERRKVHVLTAFEARQLTLIDLYPARDVVLGHAERFANRPLPQLLALGRGPDPYLRLLLGAEPPISDAFPVVKLHSFFSCFRSATTAVGTRSL